MITLRGMTWNHSRGYDPMVATAAAWKDRTGVDIVWDKRSLQDFETFPVEDLARQYDLIVIDHPHVGVVTATGALSPLDSPARQSELADLAAGSVGGSFASYTYAGHQWALPIDAAAQVMAWRADLLATPPTDWNGILQIARLGRVVWPMLAPHSLMSFFTLAANMGAACGDTPERFIDPAAGAEILGRLREITALITPSNFAMDPIAASEAMARPDAEVALMPLGYGYVSYARDGFRPGRLTFGDIPLPGHRGSALGGTGIAVSAFSAHRDAATDYAFWVASGAVQTGLYASSGGQPGHARAWEDPAVNAPVHDFYRATRKTLEASFLRPRHNGYMAFQDAASRRLNAGLIDGHSDAAILADLDTLFRGSF